MHLILGLQHHYSQTYGHFLMTTFLKRDFFLDFLFSVDPLQDSDRPDKQNLLFGLQDMNEYFEKTTINCTQEYLISHSK